MISNYFVCGSASKGEKTRLVRLDGSAFFFFPLFYVIHVTNAAVAVSLFPLRGRMVWGIFKNGTRAQAVLVQGSLRL